jgi:hypothetical protein
VSRYISLLFLVVSCTYELLSFRDGEEEEILSSGQISPICKPLFLPFLFVADDDAQRITSPTFLVLAHLPPTLLRRTSLITNGACQSLIKTALGGHLRLSVLPVGLIPEAQEAMQVPKQDTRAGAEVNIMRAMK